MNLVIKGLTPEHRSSALPLKEKSGKVVNNLPFHEFSTKQNINL
jgi:hypothetical protein